MLGKCAVPFDPAPAVETSGIRLGTGCCAALGMGPAELAEAGALVGGLIAGAEPDPVAARVRELARAFPGKAGR
jgi:glycine hydroxymethyltransferase